uniref:Conserved oligomeric Golgi complex subunit 7 n=1 Tax=Syphacia muris TaxID=451379 RepID=A0A0N5AUV1_9BILA
MAMYGIEVLVAFELSSSLQITVPTFPEQWSTKDLLDWINSRTNSSKELLEAVDASISSAQMKMAETKAAIERISEEENVLEACDRLCFELRDRLKIVVEAQAKEQITKEFDAIAVFDKADRRATELADIILARRAWSENMKIIESLEEGEPPPENVVFGLHDAYSVFSKYVEVKEKKEVLEKMKDVFLSWYSTRAVLALQSENPAENLFAIKQKYDLLGRTEDFLIVLKHFIKGQSKLDLLTANSLPDLFIDAQKEIISIFTKLREGHGWADKVLEHPSEFIANTLLDSFTSQWSTVKEVLTATLQKTAEEDSTGAASLKMILALRQILSNMSAESEEDRVLMDCILDFGLRLLAEVARDYSKLATSFLATHSNIFTGTGTMASIMEQVSNGLTQLFKEGDYLVSVTNETFGLYSVIYIVPAFRTMYENVISLLLKLYKMYMEKTTIKENDILRFVSIMGQVLLWIENDRKRMREMLEIYQAGNSDSFMRKFAEKLSEDVDSFDKKVVVKADCDLGITKSRAELRKLNKRVVARTVEIFSTPIIAQLEAATKEIFASAKENEENRLKTDIPSFGTSPNDQVTGAGVAMLSLAHQLSAHSLNSNMAASLAFASKVDSIDDVASWWIEKCAYSVQSYFVDSIRDIASLPLAAGRQFAVDYAYLADVFEDLGTPQLGDFKELRQKLKEHNFLSDSNDNVIIEYTQN